MSTEILSQLVFLNMFEKGKILRKIWICLNNFFLSNQLKGININQNFFSPQSEPHTGGTIPYFPKIVYIFCDQS